MIVVLIIPYFIQHRGCPHRCLFCNQNVIAGTGTGAGSADSARPEEELQYCIENWIERSKAPAGETQVAFFGGSFTCLDESVQRRLLEGVQPYLQAGRVDSIRLSTRPDCLSEELCEFLYSYGVRCIELGVQSMDDTVLAHARRGHCGDDSRKAIELLIGCGFQVGVQLMPGLPGETTTSFLRGVAALASLQPHFARLYPTLVINDTELAGLYRKNLWKPLSLYRALTLCRRGRELFNSRGIRVIRMGLQPSVELENKLIAGPYHPAFGELVQGRSWYLRVRKLLRQAGREKTVEITISDRDYSAFVGSKKKNLMRLQTLPWCSTLIVKTDKSLERGTMHHVIS